MKKLLTILSLMFLTFTPVFGQKEKNESLQQEALDDIEVLSSKNFPYIEQFHKAVREKMSGNYAEAKKLLNACLEERQDDDAVYFALAEIAKAENNIGVALENFKKAYAIDPDNTIYLQEFAYVHFERANFEQAEVLFKEMVKREPRNVDFRYVYSKVLIYNKAYQLAIEQLTKLQDQAGIIPELMIMKADLYSELKMFDKTEEMLLLLKKEYPTDKDVLNNIVAFYEQQGEKEKALKLIGESLKNNPDNGMAKFVLANDYLEKGEIDEFLKLAPRILINNQVNLTQKLSIFEKIQKLKGNDDPMVIESAEALYNSHSEDFEVASNFTNLLISNRQSKRALNVARKATADNPDNFNSWKLVLSLASDFLDYEALYEDGNSAIELFPSIPILYFAAAEGALNTNRTDEALQLLASGKIYLLNEINQEALFTMRKGEVFFQTKQYKKGIVAFEKALSNNPEEYAVITSYALVLSKANIVPTVANEMLSKIPDNKRSRDFYLAKALLSCNTNNLAEGIKILENGIINELNNAELYDLLGDLHIKNHSTELALEAWKNAQKFESRNKTLSKKIKEVKYYAPVYN